MGRSTSNWKMCLPSALILAAVPGCRPAAPEVLHQGIAMKLDVTSTFADGALIPKQYTGDGDNLSPPLRWSDTSDQTKSFALICDDPDAPRGTWVHWVLYNISPDVRTLSEGVPRQETLDNGARQGKNDFGAIGYGGPAPPPGPPHRYFFKLYALDTMLDLPPGATKEELLDAMKNHLVSEGRLMGRYQR